MNLAIDIGNTSTTLGVFLQNNLVEKYVIPSNWLLIDNKVEGIIKNLEKKNIKACAISSVVENLCNDVLNLIEKNITQNVQIIKISDFQNKSGILLDEPETLGTDRIIDAFCAREKYGAGIFVVDFGTATTIDVVDQDGNFSGGVIFPGISTNFKALHSFTSKLPIVEVAKPKTLIAKNTQDAILSGVIFSHAKAVEGILQEMQKCFNKNFKKVATGGFCDLICEYMNNKFDFIDKNLTVEGIANFMEQQSKLYNYRWNIYLLHKLYPAMKPSLLYPGILH